MAETAVSQTNKAVVYRGRPTRERAMPPRSAAQARAMFAAAAGKSTLGIPAKVGKEFTADQAPGSVKRLPEHVAKKRVGRLKKSGRISDRQERKTFGERFQTDVDAASS